MRQQHQTAKQGSKPAIPSFESCHHSVYGNNTESLNDKQDPCWQLKRSYRKGFIDPKNTNFLLGSFNGKGKTTLCGCLQVVFGTQANLREERQTLDPHQPLPRPKPQTPFI